LAGAGGLANTLRAAVMTLAGRPSIIFGRFGVAIFVLKWKLGTSLLAGWLTLAMFWLGPERNWFEKWSGFDLFVGAAAMLLNGLFIKQTLVTARRLDRMERGDKE